MASIGPPTAISPLHVKGTRKREADEEHGGTRGEDAAQPENRILSEKRSEEPGLLPSTDQGRPPRDSLTPQERPSDWRGTPSRLLQKEKPQVVTAGEQHVFWSQYLKAADVYDNELVKTLYGDLDTLLIFAGLFSAVNTAFIIESHQDLKPDPAESSGTNTLLRMIALSLNVTATTADYLTSPTFIAPHTAIVANSLFFASLSCSLFSAFGAVLAKQWLSEYERTERHKTPEERARRRHAKYLAMERYHCELVVQGLGSVLQFSLFLFLVALAYWLWCINSQVSYVVVGGAVTTFTFYTFTTIISIIDHVSPFSTRLSATVRRLWPSPSLSKYPGLKECTLWLSNYATAFEGITAVLRVFLHLLHDPVAEVGLDVTEIGPILMDLILSTNLIPLGLTDGNLFTTLSILLEANNIWAMVSYSTGSAVAAQLYQALPRAVRDASLLEKIIMVLDGFPTNWHSNPGDSIQTLLSNAVENPSLSSEGCRSGLSLLRKYYLSSEDQMENALEGLATAPLDSWQWKVTRALATTAWSSEEEIDDDEDFLQLRLRWAAKLGSITLNQQEDEGISNAKSQWIAGRRPIILGRQETEDCLDFRLHWAAKLGSISIKPPDGTKCVRDEVAWKECFATPAFITYIQESANRFPGFSAILSDLIESTHIPLPLGLSTLIPTIEFLQKERGTWKKMARHVAYDTASQLHRALAGSNGDIVLCEKIVLVLEDFASSVQFHANEPSLPPTREFLTDLLEDESISPDGRHAVLSLHWAYHLNTYSLQKVYDVAISSDVEKSWAQKVAKTLAITTEEADVDTTRFIFRITWAQALNPVGVKDYPLDSLWSETFGSSNFGEYIEHATVPARPTAQISPQSVVISLPEQVRSRGSWIMPCDVAWNLWAGNSGCQCGRRTGEKKAIESCWGPPLLLRGVLDAVMIGGIIARQSGADPARSLVGLYWWYHLRRTASPTLIKQTASLVTWRYLRVIIELVRVGVWDRRCRASRNIAVDDLPELTAAFEAYIDECKSFLAEFPIGSSQSTPDTPDPYNRVIWEDTDTWGDDGGPDTDLPMKEFRLLLAVRSGGYRGINPVDVYQPLYNAFKRAMEIYTTLGPSRDIWKTITEISQTGYYGGIVEWDKEDTLMGEPEELRD